MKKFWIIILIIILVSLAIGLTKILIFAMQNNGSIGSGFFHFGEMVRKEEYIQKQEKISIEGMNEIKLNFKSSDLNVYYTDENQIRVVQYSYDKIAEDELFTHNVSGSKLEVKENRKPHIYLFYFNQIAYDVYLPKTYQGKLDISSISGNISIDADLILEDLTIETTSADIQMKNLESKDIYLKTISGNINLGNVISDSIEARTTSGDIKMESAKNKVQAKSVSGKIDIEKIEGQVEMKTTSGDIKSESFLVTGDSKVETISGNIKMLLTQGSNCEIQTKTVSGNIHLPNGSAIMGKEPFSKLRLESVSGNIRLEE